jgi:hypothetical protein
MRAERRMVDMVDKVCDTWKVHPHPEDSVEENINVSVYLNESGVIESILISCPEKLVSLNRRELNAVLEILKSKKLRPFLGVSESRELRALLEVLNTNREYRMLLE